MDPSSIYIGKKSSEVLSQHVAAGLSTTTPKHALKMVQNRRISAISPKHGSDTSKGMQSVALIKTAQEKVSGGI